MEKNDRELFAKVLCYAVQKHQEKDQKRKDGSPYIWHPIAVAQLIENARKEAARNGDTSSFNDIRYQIVALLHDTLEDTDATEAEIAQFGEGVLIAVKLLTRAQGADEKEYVDAILKNDLAAVVKSADVICNMRDTINVPDQNWARKYIDKKKKYYEGRFSKAVDDAMNDADAIWNGQRTDFNEISYKDLFLYNEK